MTEQSFLGELSL